MPRVKEVILPNSLADVKRFVFVSKHPFYLGQIIRTYCEDNKTATLKAGVVKEFSLKYAKDLTEKDAELAGCKSPSDLIKNWKQNHPSVNDYTEITILRWE